MSEFYLLSCSKPAITFSFPVSSCLVAVGWLEFPTRKSAFWSVLFTSWFSWQQWGKDRILGRCLEKVHFSPVWAGGTILAFFSSSFFFFLNLSSACFELSYFKALDTDLYVYNPFAFNLIIVCYLWIMRGGNSLSCSSQWSAALGLIIVVDIVMSDDQLVTGESPQFTQSLTSYLHTSLMSKFLFY